MCVVSNLGDHFGRRIPEIYPWAYPKDNTAQAYQPGPSRAEFEALRAEMREIKDLLIAAKKIDAALGTPDCENDEKVELLKRVAELVGVDLEDVLGGS